MLAVMKKFEMSWESFTKRYRDSSFFKTDFDSFGRDDDNKKNNNSTQNNNSTEAISNMEEENGRRNVIYSELFQKQWPKNSFHFMQVLLKQMKDYT